VVDQGFWLQTCCEKQGFFSCGKPTKGDSEYVLVGGVVRDEAEIPSEGGLGKC
jgi:hypothetical protein